MEMFKINAKLQEYPCGPIDQIGVFAEISKISDAASRVYKDETEAIPATQFILVKSDEDYLRVECHSKGEVHFSSDRLIYDCGWFRKIFANPLMQFRTPIENAKKVVCNYFKNSREEFERAYSSSYTHKESLEYVELSE